MHVRLADESVCIGPPPPRDSYLNIPRLLAACEITGADAVHPGYGFLSENARFAEILEEHKITFIGPTSEHIRIMGDKIEAKETAKKLGIPVVPGSDGAVTNEAEAMKIAKDMGFPVLIKATAGGGGRGMKVAHDGRRPGRRAVDRARRSQGRLQRRCRLHREVSARSRATSRSRCSATARATPSISASATARCSAGTRRSWRNARRRPSTRPARKKIGETVADAMRKIKYRGAGTVEFLYEDGEFYFIEMNTRLQVEHPVTEMVTGIDLVLEQIRVASGAPLELHAGRHRALRATPSSAASTPRTRSTFRPSPGQITYWHPPGGLGVRVDSGVYQGYRIPPYYDSLIGKLIVHGKTRNECLMRLRRALSEFVIDGIETTIPLFQDLVTAARHRQRPLRYSLARKTSRE